jgi:lipopolysaccharide transport protein LptA
MADSLHSRTPASNPGNAGCAGRHAAWLAAGAMLLGASAAAAPAPTCAKNDIVVDAKTFEVDPRSSNAVLSDVIITQCDLRIQAREAHAAGGLKFDNGEWTISGDVLITAEGGRLTSDKAVVSFRNRLISQAVITGSPAQFEQKRDDGNISRGRAGTIDYQTGAGTVSLSNNAWLTLDGKNQISGETMVYNIRTQSMQGRPKANTPEKTGTGRIRIVIPAQQPDDKEEKKP